MSGQNDPNIGATLILIHRVVTRALDVAGERSQAFMQAGYPDDATRAGFENYVQSLISFLQGHHITEDEIAFPYFRAKKVNAPFDRLATEHQAMEAILEEMASTIEEAVASANPTEPLTRLNDAIRDIQELWRPHTATEEEYFSSAKLAILMTVDEHIQLGQQLAKYSQEHRGPDYLLIPFTLYNLSPEDRAVMSKMMPPVLIQELVPKVWKEQWAPMKPFLLD